MSQPEETQLRLLRTLAERPQATQRELAAELNVSLGKINYCLAALGEKGWVKVKNFRRNPAKLCYLRVLTPAGLEAKARLTARFLKAKLAEYESLREEIAALQRELPSAPRRLKETGR